MNTAPTKKQQHKRRFLVYPKGGRRREETHYFGFATALGPSTAQGDAWAPWEKNPALLPRRPVRGG